MWLEDFLRRTIGGPRDHAEVTTTAEMASCPECNGRLEMRDGRLWCEHCKYR